MFCDLRVRLREFSALRSRLVSQNAATTAVALSGNAETMSASVNRGHFCNFLQHVRQTCERPQWGKGSSLGCALSSGPVHVSPGARMLQIRQRGKVVVVVVIPLRE
jgi:hypothetical protein